MADNEPVVTGSVQTNQPAPAVVPEPVVAAAAPAPAQVPDAARERTRDQFEKLLESNKRLFDQNEVLRKEIEQRRDAGKIFNPVQQTQVPGQGQQINPNDFVTVDPVSGEKYIDDNRLKARIEEINQRTAQQEQKLQQYVKTFEEREIERQNNEAFSVYPELKPGGDKFDSGFHALVTGALYNSMVNTDIYGYGRPLTFKEAADFVATQTKRAPATAVDAEAQKKAEAEAAAATAASQQLKEQSSAQASSQPRAQQQQASDNAELESLRYRTRYLNDDNALAERIKHTEHILPRDSQT